MRINQKSRPAMADGFESALNYIAYLDKVPFHIKREAALEAARAAFDYIEEKMFWGC